MGQQKDTVIQQPDMDSQIPCNFQTLSLFAGDAPSDKQSFLPFHPSDQKNPRSHWKLGQ